MLRRPSGPCFPAPPQSTRGERARPEFALLAAEGGCYARKARFEPQRDSGRMEISAADIHGSDFPAGTLIFEGSDPAGGFWEVA